MDALGGVRQVTQDDVAGRQVGVLVEEVVLRRPHILETRLVGCLDHFDVVHDRNVLGVGHRLAKRLVHWGLDEDAELQWVSYIGVSSTGQQQMPSCPVWARAAIASSCSHNAGPSGEPSRPETPNARPDSLL